jgi:hypothetical protein
LAPKDPKRMLPRVQTERLGFSTGQIGDDIVAFGNWEDAILGMWGGWDVVIDPYTSAQTATVNVTINAFIDTAVRHSASFAWSTDAGNQ